MAALSNIWTPRRDSRGLFVPSPNLSRQPRIGEVGDPTHHYNYAVAGSNGIYTSVFNKILRRGDQQYGPVNLRSVNTPYGVGIDAQTGWQAGGYPVQGGGWSVQRQTWISLFYMYDAQKIITNYPRFFGGVGNNPSIRNQTISWINTAGEQALVITPETNYGGVEVSVGGVGNGLHCMVVTSIGNGSSTGVRIFLDGQLVATTTASSGWNGSTFPTTDFYGASVSQSGSNIGNILFNAILYNYLASDSEATELSTDPYRYFFVDAITSVNKTKKVFVNGNFAASNKTRSATDNFSYANGNLSTVSANLWKSNYLTQEGIPGEILVENNKITTSAVNTFSWAYYDQPYWTNNQKSVAKVSATANAATNGCLHGVTVRSTGLATGYMLLVSVTNDPNTNAFALISYLDASGNGDNLVFSAIDSPIYDGDEISLEIVGYTLTARLNGRVICGGSFHDSNKLLSRGSPGVVFYDQLDIGNETFIDDWSGYSLDIEPLVTAPNVGKFLPQRWKKQPQGAVQIDWNNPLTKGIVLAQNGNELRDVVFSNNSSVNGSKNIAHSLYGRGIDLAGSNSVLYQNSTKQTPTTQFSILSVTQPASGQALNTNSSVFGRAVTGSSQAWGLGFYVSGFGTNGFGLNVRNSGGFSYSTNLANGDNYQYTRPLIISGSAGLNYPSSIYLEGVLKSTGGLLNDTLYNPGSAVGMAVGSDNGTTSNYNGKTFLNVLWNRVLSNNEHLELGLNPWQIFKPNPGRMYFIPGATKRGKFLFLFN